MVRKSKKKITSDNYKITKSQIVKIKRDRIRLLTKKLNFVKKYHKFFKKLSSKEKKALENYKMFGYSDINNYLLNDTKIKKIDIPMNTYGYDNKIRNCEQISEITLNKLDRYIENNINFFINNIRIMDDIFNNKNCPKLTGTELLYRGIQDKYDSEKYKEGNEIIMKNFQSTSLSQNISQKFMKLWSNKDKIPCCLFEIIKCKDVPFIYLPWDISTKNNKNELLEGSLFEFGDEFEVLLPRNLKFKILKVRKNFIQDTIMSKDITDIKNKQILKLLKKEGSNNITNDNLIEHIDKIFKNIYVITIKLIEQLPLTPINDFVLTNKIPIYYNKPITNSDDFIE